MSVLLNTGDGTFQAPQTLVSGGSVTNADSVAVADLNGDGKPDLAVGTLYNYRTYVYPHVEVLLNDGGGSFVDSGSYQSDSGRGPVPVAHGHQRRRHLDIAYGTIGGSVDVLLNRGDGIFAVSRERLSGMAHFRSEPISWATAGPRISSSATAAPNTVSVFLHVPPAYRFGPAPPTVAVGDPTTAVVGQVLRFTLRPSDPTPADQAGTFRYAIDWDGDGTFDQTVTGPAGLTVTHTYAAAGGYAVRVWATDQNGLHQPPPARPWPSP